MELEQREFDLIRDMVYGAAGLRFEDHKRSFVQTRVGRRMAAIGCTTAREYYRHLRFHDPDGEELQKLIESLTTNETYFFREYPQLQCFANEALPEVVERKRALGRRLKIWSAACSTGDEPYTLAIILQACLEGVSEWQVEILATDIDLQALARAQRGVYSARAVKDVPRPYLKKYFRLRSGMYHVVPEVKRMVTFAQVNLLDRHAMRCQTDYDFIFCRNVLIYFDDAARRKVLGCFYDSLLPGGFIFLGHSESVGRISAAFEMVSLGGYITCRRPLDGRRPGRVVRGGALCLSE